MTERAADAGDQGPRVIIGKIIYGSPSTEALVQANLPEQVDFLEVIIPVTVWFPPTKSSGFDLVVSAELHAPRDRDPASVHGFSPATTFKKAGRAIDIGVDIKLIKINVPQEIGRDKMVSDVSGLGTSHLTWTILGRNQRQPGNQVFRFLVREQDVALNWLEVTAVARAASAVRFRPPTPVSDRALSPVLAATSPRAASTLTLIKVSDPKPEPFFVGVPLDLPLAMAGKLLSVARSGNGPGVIGSIRWFDNVDGRPGYKWMQRSSTPVRLGENPGIEISSGRSKFLENSSVLTLSPDHSLQVLYQPPPKQPPPTVREVLDIDVVVDEATICTHRTKESYIAVGREGKNINIDRLDVSALHGYLEYAHDHWSYTQVNADSAARLHRKGSVDIPIPADRSERVEKGDVIRLRKNVWLVIR